MRFEPDTLSDPLEDMLLAAADAGDTPRLLIAAEVVAVLRVDPGWVYDHASLLGALRLGTGRRRAVRFEARTVAARLRAWRRDEPAVAPGARARGAAAPSEVVPCG